METALAHNISFALIGQRYTVESDILQQLVFDKLRVNDEIVNRAYPSPMDLLYVLGNERALKHLDDELAHYGYQATLDDLRVWLNSHSHEFWQNSFYNYWLNAIRTLSQSTNSEAYPTAMRSDAWADKNLNTQLGSWTQLRHDNILYVKPPFSPTMVCEYPAGYVEPYPDFYAAISDYGRFGQELFAKLSFPEFEESYEEIQERLGRDFWLRDHEYRSQKAPYIRDKALRYFQELETTMNRLGNLAKKELAAQAFNEDDNLFLRSMIVRKYVGDTGYGGRTEEDWDGWFNDLLPFGDDSKQLIADVYTNYNSNIGEIGVLHLGTEEPSVIVFLLDSAEKPCVYVGASFTVREHRETANPPKRLTDAEWRSLLYEKSAVRRHDTEQWLERSQIQLSTLEGRDDADALHIARLRGYIKTAIEKLATMEDLPQMTWTKSFRPSFGKAEILELPAAYQDFAESLSPELAQLLDRIYEEIGEFQGRTLSGRRSLGGLAEILLNEPELIRKVEGINETLFQELQEKLKEKGQL